MEFQHRSSSARRFVRDEDGMALITTIMVLMLCSALMVGFVAAIISDNRVSSVNNDQTQAYAAAHAGLEKLTSDLAGLFLTDFSPSATQVNGLTTTTSQPTVPGFNYLAPDGTSGYTITFLTDAQGNPKVLNPLGTTISHGPYDGFKGLITEYTVTVTARSNPGAEVRMRRTLQTIAVPVFQFGMFSETDLAFHAGDDFTFGGRVHTNGNLFLSQADSSTLTLSDRVTAVGEVIRTHLPNGLQASSNGYNGTVNMIKAPNSYRALLMTEGSLLNNLGSTANEPKWTQTSVGTYNSYIRNTATGARPLKLPLVSQGAMPIDIIRRAPVNENVAAPLVYAQRYYGIASLRILLSDVAADITGLPQVVTATQPVSLSPNPAGTANFTGYLPGIPPLTRPPLAASGGTGASGNTPASMYKSSANEPLLNGVIKIEMQRQTGVWEDVTDEILSLGIAGRNLADPNVSNLTNRWNTTSNTCLEPNPNAVIRLQRVRDVPQNASTGNTAANIMASCGYTVAGGVITAVAPNGVDYWPNALYDPREGHLRDGLSGTDLALGGIMQYVELDVNNLRRWLIGQIGTRGTNAKNDNGFVVYFSDRRNNRNGTAAAPGNETGEYGFEDVINPASTAGTPNGTLDVGEDVDLPLNGLDVYGAIPRNFPAGAAAPLDLASNLRPTTLLTVANKALVARANRQLFFRRALKIVHGGLVGGVNSLPSPGLTIASENPVYLQGDYNATSASVVAEPNVAAAVIADSVTLLSNAWSDTDSFLSPTASDPLRNASTTGYRAAFVTGKTLPFPKPSYASSSFGSDGGAHNFLRNLENWNISGVIQRYRGSLVSFYTSRQAIGSFKCCLGDTYVRGEREWAFDTDFLIPSQLPPATPMFRDINTLTFRQLLRPTQ
jgi:hypothetical protein